MVRCKQNDTWLDRVEFNRLNHEVWAEVDELKMAEVAAAEEAAVTLKFGSDISLRDFVKCPGLVEDTIHPVTHIFRVERISTGRKYLGAIYYADPKVFSPTSDFEPEYLASVNFPMRHSRLNASYRGFTLYEVIEDIECTSYSRAIGFKILDLVEI